MKCEHPMRSSKAMKQELTSLSTPSEAGSSLPSAIWATQTRTSQQKLTDYGNPTHTFKQFTRILAVTLVVWLALPLTAKAEIGIATWYDLKSVKAEGNSGITASGEKLDESSLTCALRSRKFGTKYKVTNLETGNSIVCRHNDFGPGRKQSKEGKIIDLTPAAFKALGGNGGRTRKGIPYGELKSVRVEVL